MDLLYIFTTAFFASLSHCIGMCGGIVLAFSKNLKQSKLNYIYHFAYHFGRTTTYTMLGIAIFLLSSIIRVTNEAIIGINFFLGFFMIFLAFSLTNKIKYSLPSFKLKFVSNLTAKFIKSNTIIGSYILGLLNGLLPCGLVYFFLLAALNSTTLFESASVMFVFGIATIPALLAFGLIVNYITNMNKFRTTMNNITFVFMLLYGVFLIVKSIMFFNNPQKLNKVFHKPNTQIENKIGFYH